jgi:hypothetical protein
LAVAPAATGVLALLMAFARWFSGTGTLPIGLLLVCVVQICGYLVARNVDAPLLARSWLVALVTSAGLLPLLSLQVSLLHEPYVSFSRHSATPAIVATGVAVLVTVVVASWCGSASWSAPEVASITFLPAALLVPAALGIGSAVLQRTALETLAEASLFAAGAIMLAWSLPRAGRLLVPPIGFGVQTVALWLAGRGPSFPASSGGIVGTLYALTLVVTGLLVVVLPVVEEGERPRRREAGEDADAP